MPTRLYQLLPPERLRLHYAGRLSPHRAISETTPAEFERRYVYRTKHLLRLRMPRHSQCHFLRDEGCSIHAVKPTQCRIFPFWPELTDDKREWRKAAAWCPGIGKGELVQIETARELAAEMRKSYPGMYE